MKVELDQQFYSLDAIQESVEAWKDYIKVDNIKKESSIYIVSCSNVDMKTLNEFLNYISDLTQTMENKS